MAEKARLTSRHLVTHAFTGGEVDSFIDGIDLVASLPRVVQRPTKKNESNIIMREAKSMRRMTTNEKQPRAQEGLGFGA